MIEKKNVIFEVVNHNLPVNIIEEIAREQFIKMGCNLLVGDVLKQKKNFWSTIEVSEEKATQHNVKGAVESIEQELNRWNDFNEKLKTLMPDFANNIDDLYKRINQVEHREEAIYDRLDGFAEREEVTRQTIDDNAKIRTQLSINAGQQHQTIKELTGRVCNLELELKRVTEIKQ